MFSLDTTIGMGSDDSEWSRDGSWAKLNLSLFIVFGFFNCSGCSDVSLLGYSGFWGSFWLT